MHPEFAQKQNTVSFNHTKYLKQWMLIDLLFMLFFLWKEKHLAVGITAGFGLLFFVLFKLYKPGFKAITLAWLKAGEWIGKVMQPLIMAGVFFLIFTPFAMLFKLFSKSKKMGFQKVQTRYTKEDFNQQF